MNSARKALCAGLLLGATCLAVSAAPVDAATVADFVADCAQRPEPQRGDVCMSYVQGALDQIVMASGNADCAAAFDRPGKPAEVWQKLVELAGHPLAGKESLWGSVRTSALAVVPACGGR